MKISKIILGLFLLLGLAVPAFAEVRQNVPHWNKTLLMAYMQEGSEYAPLMQQAFKEWQGHLPRKLQFYFTSLERDIRLVEIDVQFNRVTGENAKNSGSTSLDGQNYFRHASIVINTIYDEEIENDPAKKAKNEEEIYTVMLQQVGKVLGLQTSSNETSVMFAEPKEGQKILQEDIDNVYRIYGWRIDNATN